MKRATTQLLLVTVLSLFLYGCSPTASPTDTPSAPAPVPPTLTPPLQGETIGVTSTVDSGSGTPFVRPDVILQEGNELQKVNIVVRRFGDLADNRIGDTFPLDRHIPPCPPGEEDWSFTHVGDLSLKWVRLSLDPVELDQARSWGAFSQFEINPCQDEIVSLLADNDISILYTIVYWDEELHALNYPDYKIEEEIKRYLDYTRMIVRHFKGRIQYYEILNEALFYVDVEDYTTLIHMVTADHPAAWVL